MKKLFIGSMLLMSVAAIYATSGKAEAKVDGSAIAGNHFIVRDTLPQDTTMFPMDTTIIEDSAVHR